MKGAVELLRSRIPAIIALVVAAGLVGIDRLTKWLIVQNIRLGESVPGIKIGDKRLIDITNIRNEGAAFGIMQGRQTFLIVVSLLLTVGAVAVMFSGKVKSKTVIASITLIVAGGIGNLIDRISQGYVVDFIELQFINFAVFNFADMCVVSGACLMFLSVVSDEIREYKARRACEESAAEADGQSENISENNE